MTQDRWNFDEHLQDCFSSSVVILNILQPFVSGTIIPQNNLFVFVLSRRSTAGGLDLVARGQEVPAWGKVPAQRGD